MNTNENCMSGHNMSLIIAARMAVSVTVVFTIKIFTESRTILSLKWKWERKTETMRNLTQNQ